MKPLSSLQLPDVGVDRQHMVHISLSYFPQCALGVFFEEELQENLTSICREVLQEVNFFIVFENEEEKKRVLERLNRAIRNNLPGKTLEHHYRVCNFRITDLSKVIIV